MRTDRNPCQIRSQWCQDATERTCITCRKDVCARCSIRTGVRGRNRECFECARALGRWVPLWVKQYRLMGLDAKRAKTEAHTQARLMAVARLRETRTLLTDALGASNPLVHDVKRIIDRLDQKT